MADKRISVLVAFDGDDSDLKRTLSGADKDLQAFGARAASSAKRAGEGFAQLSAGLSALRERLQTLQNAVIAIAGLNIAGGQIKQIIDLADAWASLQSRLKLATASQQEYATAQQQTFAIAQRLGAGVAETATLYGKLQSAVRALGGTQQEALGLTESIGQALRLSGASAGDSAAALLQFGQALASGVLRGDEFNSVMENAPRLAKALSDGLGVSTGKLRQMAEAGQLTADVVVKALQSQSGALQAEFDQLPRTVGQSLTALSNAFMQWVGGINEATGATGKLAAALGFVADHMQAFATVLTALAAGALLKVTASLLTQLIAALRTAGLTAAATGVKVAVAFQAMVLPIEFATAALGRFNVALAVISAAVVGWQVGTYLRENFKPVEALGDVIGASLGLADGAIRATYALIGDLAKGPQNAVAQFSVTLKSLGTAWGDVATQARIALMGTESLTHTQGASLAELQARISAVRLALAESVSNGMQAVADATAKLGEVINKLDQDAAKAQATVNAALSGIASVRQAQTAAIDQALTEQTASLERNLQQQKALLDQQTVSEQQRIAAETQLVIDRYTQEAELDKQATAQKLQLLQQETAARLAAAAADGKTLEDRRAAALKAEEDILTGQRNIWAQAAAAYQQHIDALIGEENRHLQAVQQVELARLGINSSIEDKIRELRRQSMSDEEALQDRKTEIAQLQAKAREAIAQGEFDKAQELANKSVALAEAVGRTKGQEASAISSLQSAQTLLNQALDGEAAAHQKAAEAAKIARTELEGHLALAKVQVEDLNKAIAAVQAVKIEVDTSRIPAALDEAQRLIAERETLLPIKADLSAAQQKLQEFSADLQAGKSITVSADITKGQAALDKLQAYAKSRANLDLQLSTAAAQGRLSDFVQRVQTLNKLETASRHLIKDNVPQAKAQIDSLNGRNTSSTHTIYVKKVEQHATGGLVGALSSAVRRLSGGGKVSGPGTETSDSIPALLSRGEFVIRASAVRLVGESFLHALNAGFLPPQLPRFAAGGLVGGAMPEPQSAQSGTPIHLHFGDRQVGPVYAQSDVAEQLRQAALMFGAV